MNKIFVRTLWACAILAAQSARATNSPAFTDPAEFRNVFWVTPNGLAEECGPMVKGMIGAGDTNFGGGAYAKVGVQSAIEYTAYTEGATNDWHFNIYNPPPVYRKVLPPNITRMTQLPQYVRDRLPSWATLAECPGVIADLEWARYLNLPVSFQILLVGPSGGSANNVGTDLNIHFETKPSAGDVKGKNQCVWDVSDICCPSDDPRNMESAGASWGDFTFAMATMVNPDIAAECGYTLEFKSYCKRNLQEGLRQLMELMEQPEYRGLLLCFAFDSELHYPAHGIDAGFDRNGDSTPDSFVDDYHPAMIYAFGKYLAAKYGDSSPTADSNGDGITFWSDYGAEYLASGGFGHVHTQPTTWFDAVNPANGTGIDAPRYTVVKPNIKFWQEWMNFKVTVIRDWVRDELGWIAEAGVPADRVFMHQAYWPDFENDRSNWRDEQWLDDWSYEEQSGAWHGVSKYQAEDVGTGKYIYENLGRRDEGFGSPEFNPYVLDPVHVPPLFYGQAQVRTDLRTAYANKAHVLWPHYWGGVEYAVVDVATTTWRGDNTTKGPAGWTPVNLTTTGAPSGHTWATSTNAYFESPVTNLNAANYYYADAYMHFVLNGGAGDIFGYKDHEAWKVRWITATDTNWDAAKEVSLDAARSMGGGHHPYVLDLRSNTNWTGTVTQLRVYPVQDFHSAAWINSFALVKQSPFSTEIHSLVFDKKDSPRSLVLPTPLAIAAPYALADHLTIGTNFVVYGNNNDSDFGTAGNFFKTNVTCGGVTRAAIFAPAPNRLSMTRTGKWRQIVLPPAGEGQGLRLDFGIGIRDGAVSADGVRFRIRLRDEARNLVSLFDAEYRANAWQNHSVDLTPHAGQTINLYLETYGISSTANDNSAWAEPVIRSSVPSISFAQAFSSGSETSTAVGLYVVLDQTSSVPIVVDYAVTDGTASNGVDYTLAGGTLTFDPGVATQALGLTLVNDALLEPAETIVVSLANPSNAVLGSITNHTYTILDDDTPPTVAFEQATASGGEGIGTATVQVVLSLATTNTVTVDYRVSGGSATNGVDYTLTNGTLTFAPGATRQGIPLAIFEDAEQEPSETVSIALGNATNATMGSITNLTFTILDNDAPPGKDWVGSANANWSVGGNWSGGIAPAAGDTGILDGAGDIARADTNFDAGVTISLDNGAKVNIGQSTSNEWVIGAGGGTLAKPNDNAARTLAGSVVMNGPATLSNADIGNAKFFRFDGVISGTADLAVTTVGSTKALILNANNTFTGTVRVLSGYLQTSSDSTVRNWFGAAGNRVEISGGAVLGSAYNTLVSYTWNRYDLYGGAGGTSFFYPVRNNGSQTLTYSRRTLSPGPFDGSGTGTMQIGSGADAADTLLFKDAGSGRATLLLHVGNGAADKLTMATNWSVNLNTGSNAVNLALYLLPGWTSGPFTIIDVADGSLQNRFANDDGAGHLSGTNLNVGGTWTADVNYAGGTGNDAVLSNILLSAPPSEPPAFCGVGAPGGGPLMLTATGAPGWEYTVMGRTSLLSGTWTFMGLCTAGPDGLATWSDGAATNLPNRFYRLQTQ